MQTQQQHWGTNYSFIEELILNVDINSLNVDINSLNVDINSQKRREEKKKKRDQKEVALSPTTTLGDILNLLQIYFFLLKIIGLAVALRQKKLKIFRGKVEDVLMKS